MNAHLLEHGLERLQHSWLTFVVLGLLLVVVGFVAIGEAFLMTEFSMKIFGWLLIFAGASEVIHAFWKERGWGGVMLELLAGLLYLVVGWMVLANPTATALTLTLLIAMFLVFTGVSRIVMSMLYRFPHWGWVALDGAVSLLLGILIWRQWPISGLWVIGLFVGLHLLLNGWSLVMLGLAAKRIPVGHGTAAAAT